MNFKWEMDIQCFIQKHNMPMSFILCFPRRWGIDIWPDIQTISLRFIVSSIQIGTLSTIRYV